MSWLYADLSSGKVWILHVDVFVVSSSEDMALSSHDAPLMSVFFRVKVIVHLIIELFLQ